MESDPAYIMGRSEAETQRLEHRAAFFDPSTRHLFEDAGITRGMKVLDVGSGAGDVSLLVAELVGPTGCVVGVDANPDVVASARARAESAGFEHVSFVAGDIRDLELDGDFDAVVGRLVLMYSTDPAVTVRAAMRHVRENGLAVFQEMNMGASLWSEPLSPLHQQLARCLQEAFARGGVEMAMGTRLHEVFVAAGLEAPELRTDALIGAGREWVQRFAAAFGAGILQSVLPAILEYGVASEEELDLDTFDERYCNEIVRLGSVVQWVPFVGAWARRGA